MLRLLFESCVTECLFEYQLNITKGKNIMMRSYVEFIVKFRWAVIALIAAATVFLHFIGFGADRYHRPQ